MSELDCQKCGICCTLEEPTRAFIPLETSEASVLRKRGLPVLRSETGFDYLGTSLECTRCVALAGRIGESVLCTIYDDRPYVCRRYERGGVDCVALRAQAGVT